MNTNISLKDFLKTYTAISVKFIDEYYSFYEMCENDIFGIDADKVVKYLGLKDNKQFYERLRENYTLDVDYIIKRNIQKFQKGVKSTFYYLSFDGFEKICMQSKTKKGNSVRDYFITLRKFIEYYRDHFTNKINSLAISNKYVYIILANKNKSISKLGRTKNIRDRLKAYATGQDKHPDIKYIMIVNNPKRVETCAKLFLKESRYRSSSAQELYKTDIDKMKKIVFECAMMDKMVAENIKNKTEYDAYIVYDDSKSVEFLDINNNVIGYEKGIKKVSKKSSKKLSKKTTKKVL
jgi:phage anti-repressor protein